MKRFNIKRSFKGLFFLSILLTGVLFFSTSCNDNQSSNPPTNGYTNDSFPGMIVWIKPGSTRADLNNWLNNNVKGLGPIDTAAYCSTCDNSLILLKGQGPDLFLQHQTASGGGGSTGNPLTGDDGPIYYSYNFEFPYTDAIDSSEIPPSAKIKFGKAYTDSVTVAVFDSGIDSTLISYNRFFYISSSPSCIVNSAATTGWNFSANPTNGFWEDDFNQRHGTKVSALIIGQVNALGGTGVKLLPIKIVTKAGTGNLFNALCGFSYAANRGAKIINASFGYYAPDKHDPAGLGTSYATLFKAFIQKYLTQNNILLVAAAGNTTPDENIRNLDKVAFYPASFAGDPDLPNVIAVTTVFEDPITHNATVSGTQNFSANVVDIGVNADVMPNYLFSNPFRTSHTLNGSSFAAPVATGQICANYHLLLNAAGAFQANRAAVLNMLNAQHLIHTNAALTGFIRGQNIMIKRPANN